MENCNKHKEWLAEKFDSGTTLKVRCEWVTADKEAYPAAANLHVNKAISVNLHGYSDEVASFLKSACTYEIVINE